MNRDWPESARELAQSVRGLVQDLGGVDLARTVEADPTLRRSRVRPALDRIGVLGLDLLGDEEESCAAVLAVQACGEQVLPYPVTKILAVPVQARAEGAGLYLVDGLVSRLDHIDLLDRAVAASARDPFKAVAVRPAGEIVREPLDPFGAPVSWGGPAQVELDPRSVAMSTILDAFWVLGALGTATEQAVAYARTRHQFGRPIGQFGEIRWRLADTAVARDGLEELATYTWFLAHRGRATPADATALRLGMIEAAQTILRHTHQVFGAVGLCEEHDLVVIDRHLTPTLLRPLPYPATADLLLEQVNRYGFTGLFDVPAAAGT